MLQYLLTKKTLLIMALFLLIFFFPSPITSTFPFLLMIFANVTNLFKADQWPVSWTKHHCVIIMIRAKACHCVGKDGSSSTKVNIPVQTKGTPLQEDVGMKIMEAKHYPLGVSPWKQEGGWISWEIANYHLALIAVHLHNQGEMSIARVLHLVLGGTSTADINHAP